MTIRARSSTLSLLLVLAACGGPEGLGAGLADPAIGAAARGGGGSGPQLPPPSTVDGPAWFIYNGSQPVNLSPPDVDFDALQNQVQGAIAIGATRSMQLLVYNTSKKTALTFTTIAIEGPRASDFTIAPSFTTAAVNVAIPANKSAIVAIGLTFTAHAEGVSNATLRLVSNAGTALVALTGQTLPARPIMSFGDTTLAFLLESAPDALIVGNNGGSALVLNAFALSGANPAAFQVTVANAGFSNCFAGVELAAHSYCYLGIGVAPGANAPASAALLIDSNDPVQPRTTITLTLSP